jgi:hypothetical protein
MSLALTVTELSTTEYPFWRGIEMPRIFFTGRRKVSRDDISIVFRQGNPPEFTATIDLVKHRRKLPSSAKVYVEAYHTTAIQRFDFGTVGDCRAREALRLTRFGEWDRPQFRVNVVSIEEDAGVLLASCERIQPVDAEESAEGGRSLLKLLPKPNTEMLGELWRVEDIGGSYYLCYNKDVLWLTRGIKARDVQVLGLILPAVIREILARDLLWEGPGTDDSTEWTVFGQSVSGEPPPEPAPGEKTSVDEIKTWIDGVIGSFCRNQGRFVERIREMQEGTHDASAAQ